MKGEDNCSLSPCETVCRMAEARVRSKTLTNQEKSNILPLWEDRNLRFQGGVRLKNVGWAFSPTKKCSEQRETCNKQVGFPNRTFL